MSITPMVESVGTKAAKSAVKAESQSHSVTLKQSQNTAIIQAHMNVSVSAGNEPMSLLFKTALAGINEALAPTLGKNAAQTAFDSELDISPEATAERIVKGATSFFSAFKALHQDLSEQQVAERFNQVIATGIEKGFGEARSILDGLKVLEGDIATNIDKTYDVVKTSLREFIQQLYQRQEQQAAANAPQDGSLDDDQ
jgi:hypothetical protein